MNSGHMNKFILTILFLGLGLYAIGQNPVKQLDISNENHIIFYFSSQCEITDTEVDDICSNMMKIDGLFFTSYNKDQKVYAMIAEKDMDLIQIKSLFQDHSCIIEFKRREKLTKQKFLSLYKNSNERSALIDTQTPEKDNHNYNLARTISREKH